MRKAIACLGFVLVAVIASVRAQEGQPSSHALLTEADLKWGQAPPALPKGASLAVVSGDPSKTGPFTIRIKFPAGYKIAPHWHPTDEHLTILGGTVALGMGDKADPAAMKELSAGGFAQMPAEMRHYLTAKTDATVQVHGLGPFVLNYVNPADDPRKLSPPAK
jgi:quercetin dioxygenase-like cupin family protein